MIKEITTWPGWESVQFLGNGSYGKVYEIRRETMGKTERAALKVIRIPRDFSEWQSVLDEGMTDQDTTEYFRNMVKDITDEFDLMAKLTGLSNIVTCFDRKVIENAEGKGWTILIRMELLTPILSQNKKKPFSEEDVVQMGIDICRALEICRENKIIHRDIKPENIFINAYGDYKLGDFGIARTMEKTMASMSQKGTDTYMAPEALRGNRYGYTADIYSLSTVLYRFLNNNRAPFLPQGTILFEDREKAKDRKMNGEKVPPPMNGSKKLKAIVVKGLAYEPEKRYETAGEMRIALESCLADYKKSDPDPERDPERNNVDVDDESLLMEENEQTRGANHHFDEWIHDDFRQKGPNDISEISGRKVPQYPPKPKFPKWIIAFGVLLLAVLWTVLLIIRDIDNGNGNIGLENDNEDSDTILLDEHQEKRIDLSVYIGKALDTFKEKTAYLSNTKNQDNEIKWENETSSVTATGNGMIVRARIQIGNNTFCVEDVFPGMAFGDIEDNLYDRGYIKTEWTDGGYTIYKKDDMLIAVHSTSSVSKDVDVIYCALEGYLPVN